MPLLLASAMFAQSTLAKTCDIDADGDIDSSDITLIVAARGTAASGPTDPRDADGDGQITVLDATKCKLQCSLANCAVNSAPISRAGLDQTVGVNQTVTLNGSASSDPDGNPLSFAWSFTSRPASSSAALSDPTTAKPTFVADKLGTYVVQLIVKDGTVSSVPNSVTITASSANTAPRANNDAYTTVQNITRIVIAPGVLANDTDAQGDPLTAVLVSPPASGTLTLNADGSFSYKPATNFSGSTNFTYRANNGSANSNIATVAITVTPAVTPGLPPDPSTVAPPVDRTVATSVFAATQFLYSGASPIQTGVAPGTINLKRATVLRGKVLTRDNTPLAGVKITVLNHPEFGQTLSRSDGMFDLAVNGGGVLTLDYQKADHLSAQRTLTTPWQNYAHLPDVVMITLDTQVTSIDLSAATPIQVAQGNPVTDSDGTRRATLFFNQGTTATVGGRPLTSLNIRATEYTVGPNGPKAMPALLPPTSGYTYAVELSADEAQGQEIRFSKPVITYIENFLNFPVGGIVPVGYYDRVKAAWVPSDNGRVIKILNITEGMANLDTNGDGNLDDAATLAVLKVTDAERQQLATLYSAGQSLWRVPIAHFSPWDCNWPFGPPPGAGAPGGSGPPSPDPVFPDPDCEHGSIIECQNQVLRESIGITGTQFNLHYRSDRVPGRIVANTLDIPLSGATLPASLRRIDLEILVAGQRFAQSFPAAPNQRHSFTWDGKNIYGSTVQGATIATVRIGYVYGGIYQEPAQIAQSFAALSGTSPTGSRTRQEVTLWQETRRAISFGSLRGQVGGWSLSPHHAYDPVARVLYQGDGTRRDTSALAAIIGTVAGNGNPLFKGDGGPATQASLSSPVSVTVAADGSLYIADSADNRIRRLGPDGIITTVAGNGNAGFSGDGGPATQAAFLGVWGVAVGPDGSVYIVDVFNRRIRRVRPDGIITTVAGNGNAGFSGDGGPAIQTGIEPTNVAVAQDGSLYFVERHRIRRVGPDGIITTVAGSQFQGFSGDGGPATQASLSSPVSVTVAADGSLYIADSSNRRIRRVGPDGIITTVAGNGNAGFSGDGGPAIEAEIGNPTGDQSGLAITADGSLYIADSFNHRIRRVGPDGIITTMAGNGDFDFSGDGGPATQASLKTPGGLALAPDGSLYVADRSNFRIRQLASGMPGLGIQESAIASEDGAELYIFTGFGRHLRTLDTLTGSVRYQFGYDRDDRLISITDGDGNLTAIEWDGNGNPSAIVAPGGQRTTLTVDANSFLATVTNPANERVQLSYTFQGLLVTQTNPNGGLYRYSYDALGRLIKDEDPAGGVKTLTRIESPNGHTVILTTALGRITKYQVESLPMGSVRRIKSDSNGAQTVVVSNTDGTQSVTQPDGMLITSTRGPDPRFGMQAPRLIKRVRTLPGGQTETITSQRTVTLADPQNPLSLQMLTDIVTINGRTFMRSYDAASRTMTDTSAESRQTVSLLDAQGRVIRQELAPGIAPITVTYDAQGRVIENRQGTQFWIFSYDARNRVVARVDASGQRISLAYDNNDRVIRKTLPSGAAYQFVYDANGNRTQVILPSGAGHTLGYTPVDLDAAYTPPNNGSYFRAYNVDTQLTRITLPSGRVTDQSYDTSSRVNRISYPEGIIAFDYLPSDLTDRVARISHTPTVGPIQNIAYSYNGTLISDMTASGAAPAKVSYSYDNNFFPTNMNLVSGADTMQALLVRDRDGIISGFGPFTLTPSGPGGALSRISDGSLTTNYSYDTLARLATRHHQINGQVTYALQLSYDKVGRMTGKTETAGGTTHSYAYTYDLDGQLTEVMRDGTVSEFYSYDLNGNRISRQLGSDPLEAARYDGQDRLTQRGAVAYQFNADGFLAQRGGDTFQYSTRGQLLQATVGGQTISYGYDGLGRRVSRIDGSGATQYLYGDPSSHLVTAVRSPTGVLTALYYDTAGLLIALERGGARFYVATDQVGTPRVVNNSTGTLVKVVEYDSFGNLIADSNPAFDLPIGYAGGLVDTVTGLVHFGFRDYEPASGRWTARDPVLFEGGQGNLYLYVGNSPISNRDPLGLFCISVTVYDVVGGGAQTCITSDGASVCVEVGFGVGGGVGADSDGLAKNGGKIGVELSLKCGGAALGVEASLDTGGCVKAGPIGQLGPFKIKDNGNKAEAKESFGSAKWKLSEECTSTGKLFGKVCHQERF